MTSAGSNPPRQYWECDLSRRWKVHKIQAIGVEVNNSCAIRRERGACALTEHLFVTPLQVSDEHASVVGAGLLPIVHCAAEVITYFNARPVLVDVDRETCNIDKNEIEKKITKRTKAIIPVHYAGQPCDMDDIFDIAKKYNLFVIEDAAHAIPASYKERKIGTLGDMTCFSFYATKPLTTGEGGMVTTENDIWADKLKILRLHGISKDAWKRYTNEGSWYYEVVDAGYKYNTTDLQAALGLAQLRKVDWMCEQREEISRKYSEAFRHLHEVIPPSVKNDRKSAWHLYVLKLNLEMLGIGRNQFIEELKHRGIVTSVHFIPLYRHPYYQDIFSYNSKEFPVSEGIYERIVSLPIYPGMSADAVGYVIDAVEDTIKMYKR